jgi:O-antigen/teichoic acid export membrane protein
MEGPDILLLGRQSVKSVLALASRTFFLQLVSVVSFLIISTLLVPSEVGIYTAVIAIQRIINFFTDFGLGAALIQKKDELTQEDLNTSFTIQAVITFIIFLLVYFLRDTISAFFRLNQEGEALLLVLVFTVFISSFKTIPSILLERKINFQKLIIPQIAESLIFNAVLIVLVIRGLGVESYTYAFLLSSIIGLPFYYHVSPWKIGLGVDRKALEHLKFGISFQAKNVLATIKDDLLTVILVKFLSFSQIGYIGFAQRIAFLTYRYVVDSVTKVTFSTYSRIQDEKQVLRSAIEKSLFFVSVLMFPMLTGIILVSPYVVNFVPKWNKWEPAVISIIFFCLNAAFSSMSGILVNILDASGKVNKTLKLMVLWTVLTWLLTPVLIMQMGYNGVAIASFIVSTTIFYTVYLAQKVVNFSFLKSVYKPFLASILMGTITYIYSLYFVSGIITLLSAVIIAALLYFAIIYKLAKSEIKSGIRIVLKKNE